MKLKLTHHNGLFKFTTFHTYSPQFDSFVRDLSKKYGSNNIRINKTND